jgi:hypothetical protein
LFLVTGLVYDVTTGRVQIVVPPLCCVTKAMRDDQSDAASGSSGQGGTPFLSVRTLDLSFARSGNLRITLTVRPKEREAG